MPYQKQQELQAARNRDRKKNISNTANDIKNIVQSKTPTGMLRMAKKFNPLSDWMYILAMLAAIFKDIIDPLEFAVITYPIIIIVTLMVSIFIGMMMLLGGKTTMFCWLILLFGTIVEIIFGVNILIWETAMVFTIYTLTQSERRKTQKAYQE